MKSKRLKPWPKRADAEKRCIEALKFIAKCIRTKTKTGWPVVTDTACYCRGDYECCWCGARNALKELRYSRK